MLRIDDPERRRRLAQALRADGYRVLELGDNDQTPDLRLLRGVELVVAPASRAAAKNHPGVTWMDVICQMGAPVDAPIAA